MSFKKLYLLLVFPILSSVLFSQEAYEEVFVINIEVPIRVFKSSTFVDTLTLDDFEIYEDGKLQKIEAVYLVKKRTIERREEKKRFAPEISRNFYLFFEISEYTSKLGDAVDYFIHNVIIPGDNLIIITPMATYRLTNSALIFKSKEELASQLKIMLKKDATMGYSEYRSEIRELVSLAKAISSADISESGNSTKQIDSFSSPQYSDLPLEYNLMRYSDILHRIENLRKVDQKKLLDFARLLRNKEGQKFVFLFYQREFTPQIEPGIIDRLMTVYQNQPAISRNITGLFENFRRNTSFDVDLVKRAYADSSISIHFLFITTPRKHIPGVYFKEQSDDIYSAFKEMARATGGFFDSSANTEVLFKHAVEASENYYLLYYIPSNYKGDGQFKEIKVRVKNKKYKVIHRLGYIAN